MITCEDLNVSYDKKTIISISFVFKPGNVYALIGPNGVGKSTLLKALSGFLPYDGHVQLKGKDLDRYSIKDLSRRMAICNTRKPMLSGFKCREVVQMGRLPYGGGNPEIVEQSMAIMGVDKIADHSVDSISDGQMQKVMLARALAQDTLFLLLDEPSTFLDLDAKTELFQVLANWAKNKNRIVIYSTHEVLSALSYVDSFLLMQSSKVETHLSSDLLDSHSFQSTFPKFSQNRSK